MLSNNIILEQHSSNFDKESEDGGNREEMLEALEDLEALAEVKHNLKGAKQLVSAGGYLIALDIDNVVKIDLEHNYYFTILDLEENEDVIQISATNDTSYLWVLTKRGGFLYRALDGEFDLLETFNTQAHRIYGNNINVYYEYNPESCEGTLYPENKYITNGCQVVFDEEDKAVFLHKGRGKIIRLVNWEPTIF